MENSKKRLGIILLLCVLVLPSMVSALTVTNTTFYTSVSNYTVYVDSITLDNVTITNTTIEFYNLSSVGSNLTNINDTYNSRADFYGLDIGLTIRNINTTIDLFTATASSQDYNAALPIGNLLQIMDHRTSTTPGCTPLMRSILNIVLGFAALAILAVAIGIIYSKRDDWFEEIDLKKIMTAFVAIIIGLSLIVAIAISINSVCA